MAANCRGRIVVSNEAVAAALAREAEAYREWVEAQNRETRARNLENARQGVKDQNRALHAADERITRTVNDVSNKGELVSGLHDAVDGASAAGGLVPGVGGAIADGAGLANNAARGLTTSGIFGVLPTTGGPSALGVALDAAGNASDALGLASSGVEALARTGSRVARGAAVAGITTTAAGSASYAAQVLERGSFYTPVAQLQNIVNLPPGELRGLAAQLDQGFRPGIIEDMIYGTDQKYLSSDLRELANRKEHLATELQNRELAELQDPGISVEEAEKQTAEKKRKLDEATAAVEAARAGMCVLSGG